MVFIELSTKEGKFIGNVNELKRVFTNRVGKTLVVGWNNGGCIEVEETYEEVIEKINARSAKVNRI